RARAGAAASADTTSERTAAPTVANQVGFNAVEPERMMNRLSLGIGERGTGVRPVVVEITKVDRRTQIVKAANAAVGREQAPVHEFWRAVGGAAAPPAKAPAGPDFKAASPNVAKFMAAVIQPRRARHVVDARHKFARLQSRHHERVGIDVVVMPAV